MEEIHVIDKSMTAFMELQKNIDMISMYSYSNEIGVFLTNKLKLIFPYKIGENTLEKCLEIYPYYEKARNALNNLDEAIEKRKESETLIAAKEYESEVNSIWEDLQENKNNKDVAAIIEQTIGIVGSINPSYYKFPGLLASLGFSVLPQVTEPASECLGKSGRSSHIVALYEFKKHKGNIGQKA